MKRDWVLKRLRLERGILKWCRLVDHRGVHHDRAVGMNVVGLVGRRARENGAGLVLGVVLGVVQRRMGRREARILEAWILVDRGGECSRVAPLLEVATLDVALVPDDAAGDRTGGSADQRAGGFVIAPVADRDPQCRARQAAQDRAPPATGVLGRRGLREPCRLHGDDGGEKDGDRRDASKSHRGCLGNDWGLAKRFRGRRRQKPPIKCGFKFAPCRSINRQTGEKSLAAARLLTSGDDRSGPRRIAQDRARRRPNRRSVRAGDGGLVHHLAMSVIERWLVLQRLVLQFSPVGIGVARD